MKKAKLDDDYFRDSEKTNSGEINSKQSLNSKKNKKKKGEDFLEYAVKNGIQVNFEYEDKSAKNQEKHNTETKGYKPKFNNNYEKTNKEEYYKPRYTENNYKKYTKPYPSYKKGFYGNKFRDLHKIGNNKFDLCNPHMPRSMNMHGPMYGSFMPGDGMVPPMKIQNHNEDEIRLRDNSDESILEFLTFYLSLDNLNKDLYLRNRIDKNGFIDLVDVANHKKMKYMGVTFDKLSLLLQQNESHPVIETRFEEERVSLRNKDWENIKDTLTNVSHIYNQKKIAKKNAYFNAMNNMNYVGMHNNYFFNNFPGTDLEGMANYPSAVMGYPGYQAYHGYHQFPMVAGNYPVPSFSINDSETNLQENN